MTSQVRTCVLFIEGSVLVIEGKYRETGPSYRDDIKLDHTQCNECHDHKIETELSKGKVSWGRPLGTRPVIGSGSKYTQKQRINDNLSGVVDIGVHGTWSPSSNIPSYLVPLIKYS